MLQVLKKSTANARRNLKRCCSTWVSLHSICSVLSKLKKKRKQQQELCGSYTYSHKAAASICVAPLKCPIIVAQLLCLCLCFCSSRLQFFFLFFFTTLKLVCVCVCYLWSKDFEAKISQLHSLFSCGCYIKSQAIVFNKMPSLRLETLERCLPFILPAPAPAPAPAS